MAAAAQLERARQRLQAAGQRWAERQAGSLEETRERRAGLRQARGAGKEGPAADRPAHARGLDRLKTALRASQGARPLPQAPVRAERAANPTHGNPSSVNILLVEDHPDTAAALKGYLERCGHEVATAASRQEALAHPGLARVEALICDLGLPDGSGWELLLELRASIGPAYAVAITARALPGDEARSRRAGFQAHLIKPFAPAKLIELLTGRQG